MPSSFILSGLFEAKAMTAEQGVITRESGGKTIVEVDSQNVDFRNCETIKAAVANLVADGKQDVVLNLANVSFMDSTGLGIILVCKRSCESAGGKFSICAPQTYVKNLITLTNLHKAVPIFENEEAALAVS